MKTVMNNSRMLTTTEVARFLHVHPNTVRQWANRELIHAYRLGTRGDRRFEREEVDNFLSKNNLQSWQPPPSSRG
ncbi:MAG TPA: helix-turn-helix domain-containing protein [Dehalococcoidia bacterium]|nr:helix-turn-helix domain-containing protein [Dehalococcoidia bacterium]